MKKLILFIVVACCILSCNKDHELSGYSEFKFEPKSVEAIASDTTFHSVILNGRSSDGKHFQYSLRGLIFRYIDEFVGSDSTRVEIPDKGTEWDKYTQTSFGALYLPIKGDWYEITYDNEAAVSIKIKLTENKTNKVRKLNMMIESYQGHYVNYEVVQQP